MLFCIVYTVLKMTSTNPSRVKKFNPDAHHVNPILKWKQISTRPNLIWFYAECRLTSVNIIKDRSKMRTHFLMVRKSWFFLKANMLSLKLNSFPLVQRWMNEFSHLNENDEVLYSWNSTYLAFLYSIVQSDSHCEKLNPVYHKQWFYQVDYCTARLFFRVIFRLSLPFQMAVCVNPSKKNSNEILFSLVWNETCDILWMSLSLLGVFPEHDLGSLWCYPWNIV